MAQSRRSCTAKLSEAEYVRRAALARLVDRYDAVRNIPGRDRDRAYRDLAVALIRHDATFIRGEWAWSWSKSQDSVIRQRMFRVHSPYLDARAKEA